MEAYEPIHDTDRGYGMLTRDHIAIQAMVGTISGDLNQMMNFEQIAKFSYLMADAMIAESNKKEVS